MKYFVTVHLLKSTTKLGQYLSDSVFRKYHRALVCKEEADMIPAYVENEISALCKENPRLKPMNVRTFGYNKDGTILHMAEASVWATTEVGEKAFTDNRPFTLNLTPIMKDHTEKGGTL